MEKNAEVDLEVLSLPTLNESDMNEMKLPVRHVGSTSVMSLQRAGIHIHNM